MKPPDSPEFIKSGSPFPRMDRHGATAHLPGCPVISSNWYAHHEWLNTATQSRRKQT